MKYRQDFVTNSSSSSFVINLKNVPDSELDYVIETILSKCNDTTVEYLMEDIERCCPEDYNLVEYEDGDDEMHIWVRRDECMYDDELNAIIERYEDYSLEPKFDYHY